MRVSLIAAMSENRVIGRRNALPWRLPADLKRFKQLTTGHPIIMGRKTWESIGRALPGRESIVISKNPRFQAPGARVVGSLEEALERCAGEEEVFVIGGEAVFRLALPRAERLYLTLVHAEVEGDIFFPADLSRGWRLVQDEPHPAGGRNPHPYSFRVYERA
ncbi:MAG: dihydrofolate reductase [Planctomycetes bacterium]|nr:dihydrofolate reductase [Planctomycetota bacterium]